MPPQCAEASPSNAPIGDLLGVIAPWSRRHGENVRPVARHFVGASHVQCTEDPAGKGGVTVRPGGEACSVVICGGWPPVPARRRRREACLR